MKLFNRSKFVCIFYSRGSTVTTQIMMQRDNGSSTSGEKMIHPAK